MEILNNEKSGLTKAVLVFVVIVSLYFAVKVVAEIKNYNNIPGGAPVSNTISFDGKGEVTAAPDLATINFTIRESAKEMKDAQTKVATKETAVLSFLEKSGILKNDIKTENYSSFPKYDYGEPCIGGMMPCRQDAPRVIGYEVSEYVSVSIRDISKTGEIIKGIGAIAISEIVGPNFSVEKEDELKAEARKLAINEAKKKAETLAEDLDVDLVRIVNFYENGNYGMPMYYASEMSMKGASSISPSPELPTGENKIISNVTITYEIR